MKLTVVLPCVSIADTFDNTCDCSTKAKTMIKETQEEFKRLTGSDRGVTHLSEVNGIVILEVYEPESMLSDKFNFPVAETIQ